MRVFAWSAVAAVFALAGCSTLPATTTDVAHHERVGEIRFGIEDLKNDVALFEIVLEDAGHLVVEMEPGLRRDEGMGGGAATLREGRDVCYGAQVGMESRFKFAFGMGGSLEAGVLGDDVRVAWSPAQQRETETLVQDTLVPAWQPTHVLVALRDAADFAAEGDTFDVTIRSDAAMHMRRIEGAAFHCLVRPSDYEGGAYLDAGLYRRASDMQKEWRIGGHGTGFLWSSHSMGKYDVEMRRGDEVLQEHGSGGLLEYAYEYSVFTMPSGTYTVSIDELEGAATPWWLTFAIAYAIDLPLSGPAAPG